MQSLFLQKFQVGDSMMHKGWVGVVINGKVSITYRFANSGKMRMTSIRELSAMSGSKIYVGLQVKQLGTPILKSGPANNLRYIFFTCMKLFCLICLTVINWVTQI